MQIYRGSSEENNAFVVANFSPLSVQKRGSLQKHSYWRRRVNKCDSIDRLLRSLLRKYFATTGVAALLHNTRCRNRTRARKITCLRFRTGWFAANNIINVMPGAIWLFSLCKFNRCFALYLRARTRVCVCVCVCVCVRVRAVYTRVIARSWGLAAYP